MTYEPKWTKEWPTEIGWYWFWGQPHYGLRDLPAQLYSVEVHYTRNDMAYVANGSFMYKGGGGWGVWCPAILPELPKEEV